MIDVRAVTLQSGGVNPVMVGLVVGLVLGPLVYVHAENRGRSGLLWGAVCFLFGLLGLIAYGIALLVGSGGDDGDGGVRCAQCGEHSPEHANHCGSCGADLWEDCPECGHSNPVAADYCRNCGANTTPYGADRPPEPSTPRSGD